MTAASTKPPITTHSSIGSRSGRNSACGAPTARIGGSWTLEARCMTRLGRLRDMSDPASTSRTARWPILQWPRSVAGSSRLRSRNAAASPESFMTTSISAWRCSPSSSSNCDSNVPNARKELTKRIDDLQQTTLEISRDVQALSHELHSSKLDFLGLVPAFSSFCRELSQQKNVEVHFTHADVPPSVPRHISLCLFRILQEASHNVVKHSGVRQFDVELRGDGRPCALDRSRCREGL